MQVDEVTKAFHEASRYRADHLRKALGGFTESGLCTGDTFEKGRSKSGRYANTAENRKRGIVNVPYKLKPVGVDKMINPQKIEITDDFNPPSGKQLYLRMMTGDYVPVKFIHYNSSANSVEVVLANGNHYNAPSGSIFCIADVKPPKTSKRKADAIRRSTTLYDGGVGGTAKHKEEFGKKLAATGEHNEKD